jgi:hypothetical protein
MHGMKNNPNKSHITDPYAEKYGTGKVGIVGESAIWDGPLDQRGRAHNQGSSSGITGMEISKDEPFYKAGPITMKAKGKQV